MKKNGIFIKVFSYTIIAISLLVGVTAALFSQQFMSFYRTMQTREIVASYEPLVRRIQGGDYQKISESAERFRERNQSFEFQIMDKDGGTIYATPDADTSTDFGGDFYFVVHKDQDISIIAQSMTGLDVFYRALLIRAAAIFAVMLLLCLISAYVFARQMTGPIKALARDASKMASLEEVPPPAERRDELGALARDVYSMYDKLKETISQLKSEILRVREMEEAQRYFFSAASHELKTPIAAAGVLLEGMLANVGQYKDHPKYLRECVKLMDAQSSLVSEILETVNLLDGKIVPVPERVELRNIVASVLPAYQTLAERSGQQIHTAIPGDEIVFADGNMLKKVLSNVVLNAVQNAPPGAEIRIWSESAPSCCHLYVLNTDTHIDEKNLLKLFDAFYRVDKARSRKENRNGLWLTIVQKTLQAMGVDFSLENTAEGVLFWAGLQSYKQP